MSKAKKEKKKILATGADSNGAKYYYTCPKCGTSNLLNAEKCVKCGKKRPKDAYDNAQKDEYGMNSAFSMPMSNFGDPYGASNPFGMGGMGGFDPYNPYGNAAPAAADKKGGKNKRTVKKAAIFAIIFSILILAVIIVPNFLNGQDFVEYLNIVEGKNGYSMIMDLVDTVTGGGSFEIMDMLVPGGLAILAIFTALTLLFNIFSIKARKYPILCRLVAFIALIGALLMAIMLVVKEMEAMAYGAIIVTALALINALVTLTGKRK